MSSLLVNLVARRKYCVRLLFCAAALSGLVACKQFPQLTPDVKPPEGEATDATPDNLPPFSPVVEAEDKPEQPKEPEPAQIPDEELEPDVVLEGLKLPDPEKAAERQRLQVALLLPLSATDRALRHDAQALRKAAELALFDWRNENVELLPLDTKGTAAGAENAAREAVARGADLVLGPLLRSSVNAIAPLTRQAGVPVIAFSNAANVAGGGIYILGTPPSRELERLIGYSLSKGITRFAILAPDNPYGNVIVGNLKQTIRNQGGDISRLAFYNPAATDFSTQIKSISGYHGRRQALKNRIATLEARDDEVSKTALAQLRRRATLGEADFEAIIIPALDELTLRTIAAQLSQFEVDQPAIRYMGLSVWDEFNNLESEPPLVGAWYPAPPDNGWRRFAGRYRGVYKQFPPSLAALSYEGMALAVLAAQAWDGQNFPIDALLNPNGFQGVRGVFRLNPNGIPDRGLAIKHITREGVKVLDPAPTRFDAAVN